MAADSSLHSIVGAEGDSCKGFGLQGCLFGGNVALGDASCELSCVPRG